MQDTSIPPKFPIPFANAAGTGYIRSIPQASQQSVQNGAASLTDGFPPNCFIAIGVGGSWPFGQDMNGILKQITLWNQWQQAGAPVFYDSSFCTSIGGYPKNAILMSASYPGLLWISEVDNNTNNPDSNTTGWRSSSEGRLLNIQQFTVSNSGATYTPSVGTNFVIVDVQAAGGGGGGCPPTGSGQQATGTGGYSGSYGRGFITSGFSGVTVTVGAAGSGGDQYGNPPSAGGSSSFGSLISCQGGYAGGSGVASASTSQTFSGTASVTPAVFASGVVRLSAVSGCLGNGQIVLGVLNNTIRGGDGGISALGTPGQGAVENIGYNATGFGAGGGGSSQSQGSGGAAGGNGGPGLVNVWEYSY